MYLAHRIVNFALISTAKLKYVLNLKRNLSSSPRLQLAAQGNTVNINTNVVKDVILFKYDNPRFYKIMNICAICQFVFWTYLAEFAYSTMRNVPVSQSPNARWWEKINLGEKKYRNTIAALAFIMGSGTLIISWIYTLRSVRYLILRKGGKSVTLVTYTPIGKNLMMTVELSNISCQQSRVNARAQLPIKVKNHMLNYVLDMKGEFRNTALFDYTAGLKRTFK